MRQTTLEPAHKRSIGAYLRQETGHRPPPGGPEPLLSLRTLADHENKSVAFAFSAPRLPTPKQLNGKQAPAKMCTAPPGS